MEKELVYGINLTRNREGFIKVIHKGITLDGVTDAKIECSEDGPVVKLTIKPDGIGCNLFFENV